jgi:hypothetical protein
MVGAATSLCRGSTLGAPPLPELNLPMGRSFVTSKLNSYFYPPQRRGLTPAYSLRAPALIAFRSVSRAGISEIGRGLIRGQFPLILHIRFDLSDHSYQFGPRHKGHP